MSMLFYVKKIVRDDGQSLSFDQEEIYLADDNANLLTRPELQTTEIEYTGVDGGEMIAQRYPSYEQQIVGLIIPKTNSYWSLRSLLASFFQRSHTFLVVYEQASGDPNTEGTLFRTGEAWISDNLQMPPTPRELYSQWTVTLKVGSVGLQEYVENSQGKEIFANSVEVGLVSAGTGGSSWDSVGQVWDSVGQVWIAGSGGIQEITAITTKDIYPVWEVKGQAVNPTIRNDATDTQATYTGYIADGQTLTVDFASGVASLDGIIVTQNLTGELKLANGENYVGFDRASGTTTSATLKWNNYID